MSSQSVQPSLILTQRLADGTVEWIPLARPERVLTAAGGAYALIDRADYQAPQTLVAHRRGDDLVLEVQAAEVLVLAGFFDTAGAAFHPEPDVAGGAGPFSGAFLSPESPVLAEPTAGEQVVWSAEPAEGGKPELSARDESGDEGGPEDGGVSPWLWGGLVLGGLGLGAGAGGGGGGGSGGSDSSGSGSGGDGSGGDGTPTPVPVQKTVEGSVVGGPVVEGNGLSVQVFGADGTSLLGEGKVAADGSFSIDVGDHTGVIILRVVDADPGADYLDEASGEPKDLNADFAAVQQINGADTTVVVNVNPVTTLAARVAEREAGGGALTLAQVNDSNAAIADLFGLEELHGFSVVPINGGAFDPSDDLSAGETYGAILAAFSGATLDNGGDSQQTIDTILAGLTVSGSGAAELDASAQSTLLQGARTTEAETEVSLSHVIARVVDTMAPEITSGATAAAINENSGSGQVIYTAVADDVIAVTYSLADSGDADDFEIDPDSGAVTLLEDPDFETQPDYAFTVVATDDEGNSSQQQVSLDINDLDEEPPTITSGATADVIDENSGSGQLVYTAAADDSADISDGVTFSLASGDDGEDFAIDSDTGAVTLLDNPDFETQPSYTFTVVATDAAGNSTEQTVSLEIKDIDDTPPRVTGVALTGAGGARNNTLNAGDTVTVTVTMSENTTVDSSSGTPRIALSVGGNTVFADYVSGSGSTSLDFQYTVRSGDTDTNGISIRADALAANRGVITDTSGNAAELAHGPVTSDPSFIVDTTAPTLSASTPGDDADDVPVNADFVLTFSEGVRVGSGNIIISDGRDTRTIDVTDDARVSISGNRVTIDPVFNLDEDSTYYVQIDQGAFLDGAGNAYAGISDTTTLNFETEDDGPGRGPRPGPGRRLGDDDDDDAEIDTSFGVFDLVTGVSSDQGDRTFDNAVSYDIYILAEGDAAGTWGTWSGAGNLGSDDRISLAGDGADAQSFSTSLGGVLWSKPALGTAAVLQTNGDLSRTTAVPDTAVLWTGAWALNPDMGTTTNQVYRTTMPMIILTSQGLA